MKPLSRHRLQFFHRTCGSEPSRAVHDVAFTLTDEGRFPWRRHPASRHFAAYRSRFRDGGRALVGERDGEVVFTAWIAFRSLRIDELRCTWTLPEGAAAVYDVVTAAPWRGRGIYPEALRRISGALRESGISDLWIYAEEDNAPSRSGILKAGFAGRGTASSLVVAGLLLHRAFAGNIPGLSSGRRDTTQRRRGE